MGPELIVILGTIFGAVVFKALEGVFKKDKALPATDVFGEVEAPHEYACEALPTRVFEDRLVTAGIMTVAEMTVCESEACEDCKPTRNAKFMAEKCAVADCRRKGTIKWNENEMLCQTHNDVRVQAEADKKELRPAKRRPLPNLVEPNKIRIPNSRPARYVDWPKEVPPYATYAIKEEIGGRKAYSSYEILFRWIDQKTGRQQGRRMVVPDFTLTSASWTNEGEEKPEITPPMTRQEKIEAIRRYQKNPRKYPLPPPGNGGGSPMKGNPQTY